MPFYDLDEEDLRRYSPTVQQPSDFDAFWRSTLARSGPAAPPRITRVATPLRSIEVFDVSFAGFGDDPVAGWLLLPAERDASIPGIVEFQGYGGGRGLPHERLQWAAAGYAHLIMDTRGQGATWGSGGVTPDPHGGGPAVPGMMTKGISDPGSYYYRRVITDAVRAVELVRALDGIDPDRVIVAGSSQGGGLAIAAAALAPGVRALLADVPFLSHFRRAVGLATQGPYTELNHYLSVHRGAAESVFSTLSYFDAANFAQRVTCPGLFSVALQDATCPPSTVYATYNRLAGPKTIVEYAFNDHEGGGTFHWTRQAQWLAEHELGVEAEATAREHHSAP